MGKKITEDNRKVLINDIIWCAEKRLGLDGVVVMQMIDKPLEKKYPNRIFGRYMPLVDARYFSKKFLTMIDIERANPLDLMSYQTNMKKALAGANNFYIVKENRKVKPTIRYIPQGAKPHR